MQLAEDGLLSSTVDCLGPGRVDGQPLLFAIARDTRTIFTSWNIDWRSVFKEAMPADRQVHLRVIGGNGDLEMTVAVEPMIATHSVTTTGLHNRYRVEIGYFQPYDIWRSVATSAEVEMPSLGTAALDNVDLATIPFHISFQHFADLLETPNRTSTARAISEFENRMLSAGKPNEATQFDIQILNSFNVSVGEIAAAKRNFTRIDSEKLARRTRTIFHDTATSPMRGFKSNAGS